MADVPVTTVSVSRRIEAPAARVFAILADPARHPRIDGSGMLREAITSEVVTAVGDAFRIAMHNDEMGAYEMTNRVIEFEADRRIGWEPALSAASREEDVASIGDSARQRWEFELTALGPATTLVTETYDCSRSPEWLRRAVRGGERWRESMEVTLERLEGLCTS